MYEQRQKMNKEIYEMLKERYDIVIEELPKQSILENTKLSDKNVSYNAL